MAEKEIANNKDYVARSVSFPSEMWKDVDNTTASLHTNRSELLRRAWQFWKENANRQVKTFSRGDCGEG